MNAITPARRAELLNKTLAGREAAQLVDFSAPSLVAYEPLIWHDGQAVTEDEARAAMMAAGVDEFTRELVLMAAEGAGVAAARPKAAKPAAAKPAEANIAGVTPDEVAAAVNQLLAKKSQQTAEEAQAEAQAQAEAEAKAQLEAASKEATDKAIVASRKIPKMKPEHMNDPSALLKLHTQHAAATDAHGQASQLARAAGFDKRADSHDVMAKSHVEAAKMLDKHFKQHQDQAATTGGTHDFINNLIPKIQTAKP